MYWPLVCCVPCINAIIIAAPKHGYRERAVLLVIEDMLLVPDAVEAEDDDEDDHEDEDSILAQEILEDGIFMNIDLPPDKLFLVAETAISELRAMSTEAGPARKVILFRRMKNGAAHCEGDELYAIAKGTPPPSAMRRNCRCWNNGARSR